MRWSKSKRHYFTNSEHSLETPEPEHLFQYKVALAQVFPTSGKFIQKETPKQLFSCEICCLYSHNYFRAFMLGFIKRRGLEAGKQVNVKRVRGSNYRDYKYVFHIEKLLTIKMYFMYLVK